MVKVKNSIRNITSIFYLSLLFAVIQLFGGLLTNSISILTESIRNFGDAIAIGLSLRMEKKTVKKANDKYTYGYHRFSVVGSLVSTIFLIISSLLALIMVVPRLINPESVDHNGMFIIATFGLIINGMNKFTNSKTQNINEQSVNLQQTEDVFSWVSVLIVSTVIRIYDLPVLDSLLSIIIIFTALEHAISHLKKILNIILECVPESLNINLIESEILNNPKIKDVKYFHIWSLDGVKNYASLFLVLDNNLSFNESISIKDNVKKIIKKKGIIYSTVEVTTEER